MKISYAITVCNEEVEIKKLLNLLIKLKRNKDEIVVLLDAPKSPPTLLNYLRDHDEVILIESEFKGHFSNWKNELNSHCTKDYIFNIDADEIPHANLLKLLPRIVKVNNVDLLYVPRINTVEGLTQEHIKEWGWEIDEANRVNFPDYQSRIFKNNSSISWEGKVHETIKGHETYFHFPPIIDWSLYHHKTIEKQVFQNDLYNRL